MVTWDATQDLGRVMSCHAVFSLRWPDIGKFQGFQGFHVLEAHADANGRPSGCRSSFGGLPPVSIAVPHDGW